MNEAHERHEGDLAPYLLGALEPEEERAVEVHLSGCDICSAEVDRLRLATDALPRSVLQVEPPPSLKASLMEVVEREAAGAPAGGRARRPWLERVGAGLARMRPATVLAAGAFLLAAGLAVGAGIGWLAGSDDPRVVTAQVDERRLPSASASLVVPEDGGEGAILRVNGMPPLPPERVYQLWVQRGEEIVPGPLFAVSGDGRGGAAVTDSIEDADAVMVTRERRGGARAPSEAPLLTVTL
jgi:hypothetical protein